MAAIKLRAIGNSIGATFPKEVLLAHGLQEGDTLFVTKAPGGLRLTPYSPDFEAQMEAARKVMRKRRDVLRELTK